MAPSSSNPPAQKPSRRRLADIKRLADVSSEAQFLAGRFSPLSEFLRVVRIAIEFIRGFRALRRIGPAITLFGSSRIPESSPYYALSREIGRLLTTEGYTLITGGGPGIMEAANRGARDVGGRSMGINIVLPHEQGANRFCDDVVTFRYFFARKVILIKYSYAFVILPGGFGTLDELMEAVTLIQTGKLYDFPVILVGIDYWKGMLDWLRDTVVANGAVTEDELSVLRLTDDPNEVLRVVREVAQGIGLKLHPIAKMTD